MHEAYEGISKHALLDCFKANSNITVEVCHLLVERMKNRVHCSGIINVTSGFGAIPTPYTGLFSSSQCLVDVFTRSLRKELKGKVEVLSLRLFSVFRAELKVFNSILTRNAEKANNYGYAISALKALGQLDVGYAAFRHRMYMSHRQEETETQQLRRIDRDVKSAVPPEYIAT